MRILTGVFFAGLLLAAAGCAKSPADAEQRQAARPPAPVQVARAQQESVPLIVESFGTAEPLSTIEVKAQVSGELVKVWFKEGESVKQGQPLFSIDPRPMQVALAQAEARLAGAEAGLGQARSTLARDKVQFENAQTESERNKTLLERGMVTQEEYDSARTAAEALRASVGANEASVRAAQEDIRAAQAEIDAAKLSLEYCEIVAPIEGRTGSLMAHQGDLIRANDTAPLVILTQTQPIYVSFTVPEKHLPVVRARNAVAPLEVSAAAHDQASEPVRGRLTFIDNSVDSKTSTIRLKALFENADEALWPGQYVEVGMVLETLAEAVTVPEKAVQSGQQGPYLYVITRENTAELRLVKTGPTHQGRTVIEEGVSPDEVVVTDGQLRVAPDAAVRVLDDSAAGEAS